MGLFAMFLAVQLLASPQTAVPADGVFSTAQAERGEIVVRTHCTACHGENLQGLEGPALVGAPFMAKWEQSDIAALFTKIRDTMPPSPGKTLTNEETLDAVAYLLQQNGFADGDVELPNILSTLARIPLARQTGQLAFRTGSLVRVVGCLTPGPNKSWLLTRASDLRPGKVQGGKTNDEALGSETIRLLSVFPDPSPHTGHKTEVSGLLVRDANGTSINVLSLEMISSTCDAGALKR